MNHYMFGNDDDDSGFGLGAVTPKKQATLAQRAAILAAKAKALLAQAGVSNADVDAIKDAVATATETAATRVSDENAQDAQTKLAKAEGKVATIARKAGIPDSTPMPPQGMGMVSKIGIGVAVLGIIAVGAFYLTRPKK